MQLLMAHKTEGEKLVYLDDIEAHREAGWVDAKEFNKISPAPAAKPPVAKPSTTSKVK